jgi:hypothetical protein
MIRTETGIPGLVIRLRTLQPVFSCAGAGLRLSNRHLYPDGAKAWQDAGHPLVAAAPEGPEGEHE